MERNYKQTYVFGVKELKQADIAEAETDARLLLEYVCRSDRNTLLAHGDRALSAEEYESYVNYIAERKKHVSPYCCRRHRFPLCHFLISRLFLRSVRQPPELLWKYPRPHRCSHWNNIRDLAKYSRILYTYPESASRHADAASLLPPGSRYPAAVSAHAH